MGSLSLTSSHPASCVVDINSICKAPTQGRRPPMTLVVPPPGGRWWCSILATGRRTPPPPSRLSPPLQQTSSRQVVASLVVPPMVSPPTMHGPDLNLVAVPAFHFSPTLAAVLPLGLDFLTQRSRRPCLEWRCSMPAVKNRELSAPA